MTRHAATLPVHEVMTRTPITVAMAASVAELMTLFDRHDFNAFPVLDQHGVLCGIVTKLDVLRLLRPDRSLRLPAARALSAVRVADIMRRGVISIEPEEPVAVAADLMVETRLHSLPVVQRRSAGPELVGMVSQGDLLRGLRFELVVGSTGGAEEGTQ